MRLLPKSIIVQRNRAFMSKLAYTLEQWEALPAKRPFFEKIIQARLYDRVSRLAAGRRKRALL